MHSIKEIIMESLVMCSDCGCTLPMSEVEYNDDNDIMCGDCAEELYPSDINTFGICLTCD